MDPEIKLRELCRLAGYSLASVSPAPPALAGYAVFEDDYSPAKPLDHSAKPAGPGRKPVTIDAEQPLRPLSALDGGDDPDAETPKMTAGARKPVAPVEPAPTRTTIFDATILPDKKPLD